MLGDGMRRRQPAPRTKQGARADNAGVRARGRTRPVKWHVVIPATIGALLIPFAVGYALAVFVLFPKPKVEGGGGIVVPNLVGQTVAEAEANLTTAGLGELTTIELPSPDANSGEIIAQDPLAGQQLRPGAAVSVSVSSGRPKVKVPDVEGLNADAATQILSRLGFDVRRIDESSAVPAGRIARLDPVAGAAIQLPATVTLVVSTGPVPLDEFSTSRDTLPETRPAPVQPPRPDTLFTRF